MTTPARLVDAFRRATAAKAKLSVTPRWRLRKRARLRAELNAACAEADAVRSTYLGVPSDAAGLVDILHAAARATNGGRA